MDHNFLQQKYVLNTYVNRGLTLVRGKGVFLYSEDGGRYLDLMGNYGVNIFGHGHPKLTKALKLQLKRLTILHGSFSNDVRAEASEALVKRCGENYARVYWSNSGAEAVEAALKFAVLATGKRRFIACENGYHGKTLGALSATGGDKYKKQFEPLLWEFARVPFDDIEALEKAIDAETAAFIIEPVQGEGGVLIPAEDYLSKAREICSRRGILLVIDEIQTGAGRTGRFLVSEGVPADIICLGKGLAGGLPVGATLVSEKVAQSVPRHMHTSTFGGNPLACAGVIATLNLLDEKLMARVAEVGRYFGEELAALRSGLISEIRGRGLMFGLTIKDNKRDKVLQLLQKERILAIPAGDDVVRLLPPLILEKKHVDLGVGALKKVLSQLS